MSAALQPAPCEHRFQFQGVVYVHDNYPMAGTGARARTYYDRYFCERCLDIVDKNPRMIGNSYEPVIGGATPARSEPRRF